MSDSLLDRLAPFAEGEVRSMVRPGTVVTAAEWPDAPVRSVHVVRIGGAGMSAVARLALEAGLTVSGSESQDGQFLPPLRDMGATITVGFAAENLPRETDVVIVSTAVRADNPEVLQAREWGIPVIHRASGLAGLLGDRSLVAVAGTHGKTTTTSMAALALRGAGADPGWAIGAAVPQLGANAGFGSGGTAVVEADESDGSFVAFAPDSIVLTHFEADHLDFHGTVENLRAVTSAFLARLAESGGRLVACADDDGSRELAESAAEHGIDTVLYGEHESADWRIVEDHSSAAGASVMVATPDGDVVPLVLQVPGRHNVLNALGALIATAHLGYPVTDLLAGLATFSGAQRRFQIAGQVGDVQVVDDYAHHPREVTATLEAARERAGQGGVVAVFQPHLYSRTKAFTREFAEALSTADRVVLLPIYAAREDHDPSIRSEDIAALVALEAERVVVTEGDSAAEAIASAAPSHGVIVMMGAGDIVELSAPVLEALASARADGGSSS